MRTGKTSHTQKQEVLKNSNSDYQTSKSKKGLKKTSPEENPVIESLQFVGHPFTRLIIFLLKKTVIFLKIARSQIKKTQKLLVFLYKLIHKVPYTPDRLIKLRRRQKIARLIKNKYAVSYWKQTERIKKSVTNVYLGFTSFNNKSLNKASQISQDISTRLQKDFLQFQKLQKKLSLKKIKAPLKKLPGLSPKHLPIFQVILRGKQRKTTTKIVWVKKSSLKIPRVITSKIDSYVISPYREFNRALNKHRKFSWKAFLSAGILLTIVYSGNWFYINIIKNLPNPSILANTQPSLTTKIYDRNGVLLYKIYKDENRTLVPLDDIPNSLIQATIAIEDQEFYSHPGFSIRGITRAIKSNLTEDTLHGGSTITQQLIKNTLLSSEKTITRKIKEVILSFMTEFYFTKDEILTMYFNQVPYGGTAYGVQAASRMYFDKDVTDLTLGESAFLAGLPAAPTKYSPYGPYAQRARERQKQVLRRMVEEGFISSNQATEAFAQNIAIIPQKDPILAPHFVMFVRDELAKKFGSRKVEQGGLEVHTTIDLEIQNLAQKVVNEELDRLGNLNVTNGAALVTNPKTGEILAMVGSKDYFDTNNEGQVNVTLRLRQPGSSIKPVNYALALERGLTPASIIPDSPICYKIKGQPDYCPQNYDGRYHGRVTLRKALANSYNIPAVKVLSQFGVKEMLEKGQLMGITSWEDTNRFGLALTLGGGEVKMVDMAVVYGVFANLGTRVDLNPFTSISDHEGNKLDFTGCADPTIKKDTYCKPVRALDPRVAYQISDILSDNQARSQAFGTNSVLHIPNHQVAVKTGTTNSLRDNWTIGYTNDVLVASWVGNNDNSSMSNIASGITGASPIWNQIMTSLLNSKESQSFSTPTNLVKVNVCTITGQLACNGCPSKEELFIPGTEPETHCSSDQIARILNPTPNPSPQQTASQ